ncbi:MAG: hypothetical protein PHV66_02695 [Bacteroidales bacterium]|nr:hypothetical protein [Bacteroidales bacterium]
MNKIKNLPNEILTGQKLSEYQKAVLIVLTTGKNYILEVFDIQEVKTTYTLTNGEDDFEDIRASTMRKLKLFDFISSKVLPSSEMIIRTKYYIPEKFLHQVFLLCL